MFTFPLALDGSIVDIDPQSTLIYHKCVLWMLERDLIQRLSQHICYLLSSINRVDDNLPIRHMALKMIIIDSYMLSLVSKLWELDNNNAIVIVFPNITLKKLIFCRISRKCLLFPL